MSQKTQVLERPGSDVPDWLRSTDWRPSLGNISGDLETLHAAMDITWQIICCRRAKYLEQLAYCHSESVTVQSRIPETDKDSVWMTIAALVRLNRCLRNVLTYLHRPTIAHNCSRKFLIACLVSEDYSRSWFFWILAF